VGFQEGSQYSHDDIAAADIAAGDDRSALILATELNIREVCLDEAGAYSKMACSLWHLRKVGNEGFMR
jgi:hypothetical protein